MQFAQVSPLERAARQQPAGVLAALIEQFGQRIHVAAGVGEVGKPVQCGLVALVREGAQSVLIEVMIGHGSILQPSSKGKVKCDHGGMLTIGQLATHTGVSAKTIRFYHAKGQLPEPARDASGYRRYGAEAIVDLTRVITLAQAGVPLARIRDVLDSDPDQAAEQIDQIDAELRARIRQLQQRRTRLRRLNQPDRLCLPPEAIEFMDRVRAIGLSERHERAIRDGWILGYALVADITHTVVRSHVALLDDDEYVAMLRNYDVAIDWDPDDPRLGELADASAALAQRMTLPSDLPDFHRVPSEIVDILTGHQGIDSPAWERLDQLIVQRLAATPPHDTNTVE